jgi:hypothetical protein
MSFSNFDDEPPPAFPTASETQWDDDPADPAIPDTDDPFSASPDFGFSDASVQETTDSFIETEHLAAQPSRHKNLKNIFGGSFSVDPATDEYASTRMRSSMTMLNKPDYKSLERPTALSTGTVTTAASLPTNIPSPPPNNPADIPAVLTFNDLLDLEAAHVNWNDPQPVPVVAISLEESRREEEETAKERKKHAKKNKTKKPPITSVMIMGSKGLIKLRETTGDNKSRSPMRRKTTSALALKQTSSSVAQRAKISYSVTAKPPAPIKRPEHPLQWRPGGSPLTSPLALLRLHQLA